MKLCPYCGCHYWPWDEQVQDHWANCGNEECEEQANEDRYATESGRREIRGLE